MPLNLSHIRILLGRHLIVWRRNWIYFAVYMVFQPFILLYGMHFALGSGINSVAYLAPGFLVYVTAASSIMGSSYGLFEQLVGGQVSSWLFANVQPASIVVAYTLLQVLRGLICALSILFAACWLVPTLAIHNLLLIFLIITALAFAVGLWGAVIAAKATSIDQVYATDTVTYAVFVFSGIFVSISAFPVVVQRLAQLFPFWHAVELVRPLFLGQPIAVSDAALHVAVLLAYLATGWFAANHAFHQRLLD